MGSDPPSVENNNSSLLKRAMTTVAASATSIFRQQISEEQIEKTKHIAKARLRKVCFDAWKSFDLEESIIGPDKDPAVARAKADRDYGGDILRVMDFVRGTLIISSPEQYKKLTDALLDPNSKLMQDHQIVVHNYNDCFKKPKEPTGYRATNFKIGIPVGSRKGATQYHSVELQIIPQQLNEVYKFTHDHKRAAELIRNKGEDALKGELKQASAHDIVCQLYNGLAMQYAGYDFLLADKQNILTKNRIESFKKIEQALYTSLEARHQYPTPHEARDDTTEKLYKIEQNIVNFAKSGDPIIKKYDGIRAASNDETEHTLVNAG